MPTGLRIMLFHANIKRIALCPWNQKKHIDQKKWLNRFPVLQYTFEEFYIQFNFTPKLYHMLCLLATTTLNKYYIFYFHYQSLPWLASITITSSSFPTIIRLHICKNCPVSSTPTMSFSFLRIPSISAGTPVCKSTI